MCSKDGSLAPQVDAVAAVPVGGLSVGQLQELIAGAFMARNRLDGVLSRAVGELAVRGGGQVPDADGGAVPLPAWLRTVGQLSANAAGRQVRAAVALRGLPAVSDAIVDGQITVAHGKVLTRLIGRIDAQALLDSQPQLTEVARRTDPEQLAQFVRHQIATWCEPELESDELAAEQRRFLQLRNTHRGSWRGTFELPDAAMETVLIVLEALARRDNLGDDRPAGMRRADALSNVFGLAARHGDLPDAGGSRPRVTYVVPAWWTADLAASRQEVMTDPLTTPGGFSIDLDAHPGADWATAAWTGPQTRTQVETMLCDARVERLVLDNIGRIVSLVSDTDEITAAQRRAVAARDRCCTTKGCSKPPAFCDVHHLRARADGGATDVGNLVLLCRRHHVMWHRKQLTLTDLRTPWLRLPQPRAPALE